jgi:hypothetical protein
MMIPFKCINFKIDSIEFMKDSKNVMYIRIRMFNNFDATKWLDSNV